MADGVVPMLSYEDGLAAMDWLACAFGFVERARLTDSNGRLAHGEMETGAGSVMLASPTPAYQSPRRHRQHCDAADAWLRAPWVIDGVLVYVEDIGSHFRRSKEAGATILGDLEEGEPGRRYRVEDVEGHRWMFMERQQERADTL